MKARAIATIVMTLFLVSIVGIASTASAKKPKPSHDRKIQGESVEVRAELRVDPNEHAAAMGAHPVDLDILEVAILSSGIKEWQVLKDSVSIELHAGNRSINIPVQLQRRMRDVNGDGIREHLLEINQTRPAAD